MAPPLRCRISKLNKQIHRVCSLPSPNASPQAFSQSLEFNAVSIQHHGLVRRLNVAMKQNACEVQRMAFERDLKVQIYLFQKCYRLSWLFEHYHSA